MKQGFFICILSTLIIMCSCVNTSTKNEGANIVTLDGKVPEDPDYIIELDLFSQTDNYDNNLSTIASKVEFIHLDADPPINDFRIADIAISEEYLFLVDIYQIFQYDRQGNFIRFIGNKGLGPEEFYQLRVPLQLDNKQKLIYASDATLKKIIVYQFDGTFVKTIPTNSVNGGSMAIIDTTTIAIRTDVSQRLKSNAASIKFINYNGEMVKSYPSNIYPLPAGEIAYFGSSHNFLWNNKNNFYSLEYGADTIYKIISDSLIPVRVLTGNLKLKTDELANENKGRKLELFDHMVLPNAGVFESDYYIIFKLLNDYESFYKIYEKTTGQFFRTTYDKSLVESSTRKRMEFFTDDLVSGLHINFKYQSEGKAITTMPAEEIVEKREAILDYISKNPSEEGEKLKAIVENIDEMDNSVVMIVTLK